MYNREDKQNKLTPNTNTMQVTQTTTDNNTFYTVPSRRSDAIDDIRVAIDRTHNMDDPTADYCLIVTSDCGIVAIVATTHNDIGEALDQAADTGLMKLFSVSDEDIACMNYEGCDPDERYTTLGDDCAYYDLHDYFHAEMVARSTITPLALNID